jgi:pyridoxal 5'-phosphate synthase pdxS subunit
MSSENPTIVPSSNALPTTANGNANGSSTPNLITRANTSTGTSGGGAGTFGVKTGLAQMLKGG